MITDGSKTFRTVAVTTILFLYTTIPSGWAITDDQMESVIRARELLSVTSTGDHTDAVDTISGVHAELGIPELIQRAATRSPDCNLYNIQTYTLGTVNADLVTDLRDAITCANGNFNPVRIDLDGQTVTLSDAPYTAEHGGTVFGPIGLPEITGSLIINNGVITRDPAAPAFRLIWFEDVLLTLEDLTLSNGLATGVEGVGAGLGVLFTQNIVIPNEVSLTRVTFDNNVSLEGIGGGAALVTGIGKLIILDSVLTNNGHSCSAACAGYGDGGGAILTDPAIVVDISGTTFTGNASTLSGGALFSKNHVTITGGSFTDNSVFDQGGALHLTEAAAVSSITGGTTFSSNNAGFGGAGITLRNGTLSINGATFTDNSATDPGNAVDEFGGAINSLLGSLTVTDSVFTSNVAYAGSAIASNGTMSVSGCKFQGHTHNPGSSPGGGVIVELGSGSQVYNNVFSGNVAATGVSAGILVDGGPMILTNNTFVENYAVADGPALWVDNLGTVTARNNIFWDNRNGASVSAIFVDPAGSFTYGHNVIEGSAISRKIPGEEEAPELRTAIDLGNNLASDPFLLGSTPATSTPNAGGDFRLRIDSPAIDAGDNSADPDDGGPLPVISDPAFTDLDGNARVSGGTVDIGAYEDTGIDLCAFYTLTYTPGTVISDPADDLITALLCDQMNDATIDTIDLVSSTISFETGDFNPLFEGATALPEIVGSLRMIGGTLDGGGQQDFRFFSVGPMASLELDNMVLQNSGGAVAGGAIRSRGELQITTSLLTGNSAAAGGAIYQSSGSSIVFNSLLHSNAAISGAAFLVASGQSRLTNVTIAGNTAGSGHAAVENDYGTLTLVNSIVSDNSPIDLDSFSGSVSLIHSLHTTRTAFTPNLDALSTTLEGAPAGFIDPGTNNFRLAAASPGIEVGDNAADPDEGGPLPVVTDPSYSDLDGNARVFDADGVNGAVVDLGAFETDDPCISYESVFPGVYTLGTFASDPVVDLRAAMACSELNVSDDTIDLAGQTVTLNDSFGDPANESGTPTIFQNLTLRNGTIARDPGASDQFRLLVNGAGSNLTLENLTLTGGSPTGLGGAVFAGGSLKVDDCTLSDNHAGNSGGAVYHQQTAVILSSTFTNNSGDGGGGAIVNGAGSLFLLNSTLIGNTTAGDGGAVSSISGNSQLVNVVAAKNSGNGSFFSQTFGGATTIESSTLAHNTGPLFNHAAGTISIKNSILWGQSTGTATAVIERAIVQGGYPGGTEILDVDPLFQDVAADNYMVRYGSEAVNRGNTGLLPADSFDLDDDTDTTETLPVDVRGLGFPRVKSSEVDLGAFEHDCTDYGYSYPYILGTAPNPDLATDLRTALLCAQNEVGRVVIDLDGRTVTFIDSVEYDTAPNALFTLSSEITLQNGILERDSGMGDLRLVRTVGDIILDRITLRNGKATTGQGGAVFMIAGTLLITDCLLENNSAVQGGAIFANDGFTLEGSQFLGNSAAGDGGAIKVAQLQNNRLLIDRTVFQGNDSGSVGGAIYYDDNGVDQLTSTLTNSLVTGNHAQTSGGGIYDPSTVTELILTNTTIAGNRATTGPAGGIHKVNHILAMRNVIVSGNSGEDFHCESALRLERMSVLHGDSVVCPASSDGYNAVTSRLTGLDPLFVAPLAASAAPTTGGDYRLLFTSPTLDQGFEVLDPDDGRNGSLGIVIGPLPPMNDPMWSDINGDSRVFGANIDLGPYELQVPCAGFASPFGVGSLDPDLVVDLRFAIGCANLYDDADIIDLGGQTVTFSDAAGDFAGPTALDSVVTPMTFRNGSLVRNGAGPDMRLLHVGTGGHLTLERVLVEDGRLSSADGGGIHVADGALRMEGGGLIGNAARDGGGLFLAAGSFELESMQARGNQAGGSGGAVQIAGVAAGSIINLSVSGNDADTTGGIHLAGNGAVTIDNSILWQNGETAGIGTLSAGLFNDGSSTLTVSTSLVEGSGGSGAWVVPNASDGGGNLDQAPAFLTGGNPATAPGHDGDLHLQIGSPAIEAGDNGVVTAATDADGATRIQGGNVDIGAFEGTCAGTGYTFAVPYILGTVDGNLVDDLRQAMVCAPTANGAAVIDLAGQTVTFTDAFADYSGLTALPAVSTVTTLTNGIIERDAGASESRLLFVTTGGVLTLQNLTVQGGASTTADGGAILVDGGQLSLVGARIKNNSAVNGGAVATNNGMSADGSFIYNNSASIDGGGLYVSHLGTDRLTLIGTEVRGNQAIGNGGGLWYNDGNAALVTSPIVSCLIAGNDAVSGGGVYDVSTSTEIVYTNTTIAGNQASSLGGGVYIDSHYFVSRNSILSTNTPIDLHCFAQLARSEVAWSTITNLYCPALNQNLDGSTFYRTSAFLAPVAATSAPTLAGDYRLQLDSFDLDAGLVSLDPDDTEIWAFPSNIQVPRPLPAMSDPMWRDLAGNPRSVGTEIDRGAYELQASCVGFSSPYFVGTPDLAGDLRYAVACANLLPDTNIIDLGAQSVTFIDSAGDYSGATAIPSIVSPITLRNGTVERDAGAPDFRLLHVNSGGDLTLENLAVRGGRLPSADGGAVRVDAGAFHATTTRITGNQARDGGLWLGGGTFALESVLISGNLVSGAGAGIDIQGDAAGSITNTTITGHRAIAGAALNAASTGDLEIINSVLWNNSGNLSTGTLAASIEDTGGGTVTMTTSILQGSGGSGGWLGGTIIDGGGNLDLDPQFLGAIDPMTAPTSSGDFHPLFGSPAIDAGTNSAVTTATDLDGAPRIDNGVVDLGPYEGAALWIDLAVTKTDGVLTVLAGGAVTYTITATNAGVTTADPVSLVDPFPYGLNCAWTSVSSGGAVGNTNDTGNISETLTMPPGSAVTYTAECAVASNHAGGQMSNTATVSAPQYDIAPGNNSATDDTVVELAVDLVITKDNGIDHVAPGQAVTYTVTVVNLGPSDVLGAVVSDIIPPELVACSWSCLAEPGAACSPAPTNNLNDLADLDFQTSVDYTGLCTVGSSTAITAVINTATVDPPSGVTEVNPADNSATDIDLEPMIFSDGFESGDTSIWSGQYKREGE